MLRHRFHSLGPHDLWLHQDGFPGLINSMQSEYILGEIDAERDNSHGLPLSSDLFGLETQSWQQLLPAASAAASGRGSPFHSLWIQYFIAMFKFWEKNKCKVLTFGLPFALMTEFKRLVNTGGGWTQKFLKRSQTMNFPLDGFAWIQSFGIEIE